MPATEPYNLFWIFWNMSDHKVMLRNRHLVVAAEIAADAFGDVAQVYIVYYANQKALLLAPMDDEIFPTVHKPALQMLKKRNLQGDKSVSLEEILIDNDLDDTDRPLVFMHQPGMSFLHITL